MPYEPTHDVWQQYTIELLARLSKENGILAVILYQYLSFEAEILAINTYIT